MGHYSNKPQQHLGEMAEFLRRVERIAPTSYLEIGCKFGGLVWAVAHKMARQSTIVGIDLPNGPHGRSDSEQSLMECFHALRRDGYNAHLLIGDSTSPSVINQVKQFKCFDLIFIDANHTEKFVRADWTNYGTMGKVVCFHDIAAGPRKPGRLPIEVPKVWAELKTTLRDRADFDEIRLDETRNDNGIGIVQWR